MKVIYVIFFFLIAADAASVPKSTRLSKPKAPGPKPKPMPKPKGPFPNIGGTGTAVGQADVIGAVRSIVSTTVDWVTGLFRENIDEAGTGNTPWWAYAIVLTLIVIAVLLTCCCGCFGCVAAVGCVLRRRSKDGSEMELEAFARGMRASSS